MTKTRILLADDHALLLIAFQRLLQPEYTVVRTVTDGQALVDSALELNPDLIVVDVSLPRLSGLEAARQIKQSMSKVKLVFLTMDHDPEIAEEVFRIGASALLVKTSAASELLHAIREVLRGGSFASPGISKGVLGGLFHQTKPKKPSHQLTTRQREVVQLLAEGRSMKEVALILNVTPRTVAFHKYRTMKQLNLKTFAELVQFAVHERIVSCDAFTIRPSRMKIRRKAA